MRDRLATADPATDAFSLAPPTDRLSAATCDAGGLLQGQDLAAVKRDEATGMTQWGTSVMAGHFALPLFSPFLIPLGLRCAHFCSPLLELGVARS